MAGHNKWSGIKHRKAAVDAKRAKIFTRIIKEITVAARMGGGDPDANPRLRSAIQAAKGANMPAENIDRAVKKGTGELEGVDYEEVTYEGYGPEGVAIMVDVTTDNTNRAVSEVRSIFNKRAGKMAEPGAVAWMFDEKGQILVPADGVDFDTILEQAIEAGAEDVEAADDAWLVTTAREDLYAVAGALEGAGVPTTEIKLARVPQTTIEVGDPGEAQKILNLVEALEDNDDVQAVWANFDVTDEVAARLGAE